MLREMRDLLVHPGTFFTCITAKKVDLSYPALIVLAGGLLGLAAPYLTGLFSGRPGELLDMIATPDAILVGIGMPFVAWVLLAGILFVLCRLMSGTGSFPATLQNTGYGCLPLTAIPILSILNSVAARGVMEPPGSAGTGAVIGLGLLSILFITWSGYLWAHAMERTHAIPYGKALAAAAITVLLYLSPLLLNIIARLSPAGYYPG